MSMYLSHLSYLVKIFQSQVFEHFLAGTSLQECYEAVGAIANQWWVRDDKNNDKYNNYYYDVDDWWWWFL